MMTGMKKETLRIGGMTCVSCQNRIEKKLRKTAGIHSASVSYSRGTAGIEYDADIITRQEIADLIAKLDYEVLEDAKPAGNWMRASGLIIVILAVFMLLRRFGLPDMFSIFPTAQAGMGYGMLFIIGLLTSVHCLAMCGGINLSQCIPPRTAGGAQAKYAALRPSFLYNFGRVISYTIIGALVGALGSVISFTGAMRGAVQLIAGVFMVIMGVNMLGLFPGLRRFVPRMPKIFSGKISEEKRANKSPLYVGLLNGLMPCGPLQAMQIYALSTGNPLDGALSMLFFSLGTVPLMFALGALSSVLSRKFTSKVLSAGAVLVVILGISMFSQGWVLSGLQGFSLSAQRGANAVAATDLPGGFKAAAAPGSTGSLAGSVQEAPAGIRTGQSSPALDEAVQLVNSTMTARAYPAITVVKGKPVKWIIDAPKGSINGCNNVMVIPEYGLEHAFEYGENIIEFTPDKTGTFYYSCWMGMITSTITVVEAAR